VDVDALDGAVRETRSGLVFLGPSVPDRDAGEAHARRHELIKKSLSTAILVVFPIRVLMLSIMLLVRRPSGVIS